MLPSMRCTLSRASLPFLCPKYKQIVRIELSDPASSDSIEKPRVLYELSGPLVDPGFLSPSRVTPLTPHAKSRS